MTVGAHAPSVVARDADDAKGWRVLSARYTQWADSTGRDDLVVRVGPGAGRGSPGCFLPALGQIEVDGDLLGELEPDRLDPRRPRDRSAMAVLHGVAVHEAGHAVHTRWKTALAALPPAELAALPAGALAAATRLEEARMEGRVIARRPGDRRWIRAAVTALIEPGVDTTSTSAAQAASAAALFCGRAAAGVLDDDEVDGIAAWASGVLGRETMDLLLGLCAEAVAVADDDGEAMISLGRRWCEALGDDPEAGDLGAVGLSVEAGDGSDGDSGPDDGESGDGSDGDSGPDDGESGDGSDGDSELAEAVTAALAAIADAAAEETAERGHRPNRDVIAARVAETEARADAEEAARGIFSVKTGRASTSSWTLRPPTAAERAAANLLARRLRQAKYRERAATRVTSVMPPGRLSGRSAVAAAAQAANGQIVTAEPWRRTERRRTPEPPIKVGIVTDVSGSMGWAEGPISSGSWIIAQAAHRIGGEVAAAVYGDEVTAVIVPGQTPRQVLEFSADDGTEEFCEAVNAVDGALGLGHAAGAVRLLVVVSDGHYRTDQRQKGADLISRLARNGCNVLWVGCGRNPQALPGAHPVTVDDPVESVSAIADEMVRLLAAG